MPACCPAKPENRAELKVEDAFIDDSFKKFLDAERVLPPTTVNPTKELVETMEIPEPLPSIIITQEIVQAVCDVSSSSPDCN